MIVLGIDPGFAALGLARLCIDGGGDAVQYVGVVRTQKSASKTNVLATSDNARRLCELADEVAAWIVGDVVCIAMEAQSWPRNAGAAVKVALAHGMVIALANDRDIPLVQVSPQTIKKALCGRRDASKTDVQTALESRFGPILWPKPASVVEHAADALGAAVVALDSPVVMALRRAKGLDR